MNYIRASSSRCGSTTVPVSKNRLFGPFSADRNHDRVLEPKLAILDESLDKGTLEQIPRLKDAVGSLEIERTILAKIPTWPWSADTLRTVLTAVLFPTVVFLIQVLLKQFLP